MGQVLRKRKKKNLCHVKKTEKGNTPKSEKQKKKNTGKGTIFTGVPGLERCHITTGCIGVFAFGKTWAVKVKKRGSWGFWKKGVTTQVKTVGNWGATFNAVSLEKGKGKRGGQGRGGFWKNQ